MKLNLGCGFKHREGFVNIDSNPACEPDKLMDLENPAVFGWPGRPDVDEVVAHHIFEHIQNFNGLMKWLYLAMEPGALMDVRVPHPRSDYFTDDPTHVRPITVGTFCLLSKKECARWKEMGASNTPLADILGVDFEIVSHESFVSSRFKDTPKNELEFMARHYWNIIDEVHLVIRRV